MDIQLFAQLGIGGVTLGILWLVVRYFIETLSKKDDYIRELVGNFKISVENHMEHNTDASRKTAVALTGLTKAIKNLTRENL